MADNVVEVGIRATDTSAINAFESATTAAGTFEEKIGSLVNSGMTLAEALKAVDAEAVSLAKAFKETGTSAAALESELASVTAQTSRFAEDIGDQVPAALQRTEYSVAQARFALRGLGQEMGIAMARATATFLAGIEGIGPVLAAAFAPVAVVGLVEMLGRGVEKAVEIERGFDAVYQAEQRAIDQAKTLTKEFEKTVETEDKLRDRLAELEHGKAFSMKLQVDDSALTAFSQDAERIKLLEQQIEEAQKRIATGEHFARGGAKGNMVPPTAADVEAAKIQIRSLQDALENARKQQETDALALKVHQTELAHEQASESITADRAVLDATHGTQLKRIELAQQAAKDMHAIGMAAVEQEVAAEISASNEKLAADEAYYERRKQLALRESAVTHKPATSEITSINAEEEAAEVRHQQELASIRKQGAVEWQRQLAERERMYQTSAAEIEKIDAGLAAEQQSASQETIETVLALAGVESGKAALKSYEAMTAAQAITEQGTIEHAKRMYALEKDRLDAELNAGVINADQRIELLEKIEKKEYELEMQAASAKYRTAFDKGDLEAMARAQNEIQSIADGYAKVMAGLGKEGVKVDPFVTALEKINKQMDKTVSGIVSGQTTIVGGFERMGVTLVEDMETSLIEMGVKWAEHELAKLLIHQLTNAGIVASDQEASIQRQAIELETSLKSITKSAASAAGKAHDALADIPVVGPALGAAAAATTFAGVMAFEGMISAAGGADLGSTPVLAQLHPHEMVLPQNLADVVRGAAAGGGNSNGVGHTFHMNFNNYTPKDSNKLAGDMMGAVTRGLRMSNLVSA